MAILPPLVVHADWGTAASKRWRAAARWDGHRYWIDVPEPVGSLPDYAYDILDEADSQPALIGFDFPMGLPAAYASKVDCSDFVKFLTKLGRRPYEQFFDVARTQRQVSVQRPFYPFRPGGTRREHLLKGLGLDSIDQLLRVCDRATALRGPASPLFWTLGPKQVGKAAISGWRDVVRPALQDYDGRVALWPFQGSLAELFRGKMSVVVETYPAEACVQLGLPAPGTCWSKARRNDRVSMSDKIAERMKQAGVRLSRSAHRALHDGFDFANEGEDQFDAFVGLAAMLQVLLGIQAEGFPVDPSIRQVEGWILGQAHDGVLADTRMQPARHLSIEVVAAARG